MWALSLSTQADTETAAHFIQPNTASSWRKTAMEGTLALNVQRK